MNEWQKRAMVVAERKKAYFVARDDYNVAIVSS